MFAKLRHWFIPSPTNNHKARSLHPEAFIFYILLIFIFQISVKAVRANFPSVLGFATDISVQNLLDLTNQQRVSSGLQPITLSSVLSGAAANKAADMFAQNYWAHIAPDGKSPWDFITAAGYHYTYAGENLAKNFNDSGGVVNAWMNSPSHRENMLKSEYQEVGFAVVNGKLNGEDTTLVVQLFGASSNPSLAQKTPTLSTTTVPSFPQVAVALPTTAVIPLQLQTISPTTIAPSPTIFVTPAITSTVVSHPEIKVAGMSFQPIFDVSYLTKSASLMMIGFLLFILGIDGILIYQRKTHRVSSHNFAHMLLLIMLVGVVYATGVGAIL